MSNRAQNQSRRERGRHKARRRRPRFPQSAELILIRARGTPDYAKATLASSLYTGGLHNSSELPGWESKFSSAALCSQRHSSRDFACKLAGLREIQSSDRYFMSSIFIGELERVNFAIQGLIAGSSAFALNSAAFCM